MALKKDATGTPQGTQEEQHDAQNDDTQERYVSKAAHESALERARSQEREKLHSRLEQREKEAAELQARLARIEQEKRDAELAGMKPDERRDAKIAELEAKLQSVVATAQQTESTLMMRIQASDLLTYRERVLRAYGNQIIPEMVTGNTYEEIQASANAAHQRWKDLVETAKRDAFQEAEARLRAAAPPVPAVPAPPPNPAFAQFQPAPGAGFPQVTNVPPVPQVAPSELNIREITSEDAVRSGQWGGQLRQQVLASMKGQPVPPSNPNSAPRYMAQPAPHQVLPGGVTQPMGTPMGPVAHPGMPQMPPPMPGVPQPGVPQVPSAQIPAGAHPAQAAMQRTYQGANGLMSHPENAGAAQGLADARAYAAERGIPDAQAAFAQRFAATPPIPTNSGGGQA